MRFPIFTVALACTLFFAAMATHAQTAPEVSTDAQRQQRIEQQLQELQSLKKDLQRQVGDFDTRIKALEFVLGATNQPKAEIASQAIAATNQPTAATSS